MGTKSKPYGNFDIPPFPQSADIPRQSGQGAGTPKQQKAKNEYDGSQPAKRDTTAGPKVDG